jgi:hypothetical protein
MMILKELLRSLWIAWRQCDLFELFYHESKAVRLDDIWLDNMGIKKIV